MSASATQTKTTTNKQEGLEWITDDLANLIAQAFRDGEKTGRKNAFKQEIEKYRKDFQVAKKIFEAFYESLWSNGIKCRAIRVRIGSPFCFDAIFMIPEKDYFSEGYAKALQLSKAFTTHPTPNIALHYRFMPFSKKINYEELESDGYLTSYQPK